MSVRLDKISHRYFGDDGTEYLSVSALLGSLPMFQFNAQEVAAKCAAKPESIYFGWTPEAILEDWDGRRDGGTELHAAIEHWVKVGNGVPDNHPGAQGQREFAKAFMDVRQDLLSETIVWSDRLKLAGTVDVLDTCQEEAIVQIWDIKTSRALPESKWTKFSLQLELYRMMASESFDCMREIKVGGVLWFSDYFTKPCGFKIMRQLPVANEMVYALALREKQLKGKL